MKMPPNSLMVQRYRTGLGKILGGMICLLTTVGRKSGNTHTVAVQYEKINGEYFIGSAAGVKSDWLRNIQSHPNVELEVGRQHLSGLAEVILEPREIYRLLKYRLKRHPLMMRLILKMDGLGFFASDAEIANYAARLAFVAITPKTR